MSVRIKEGVSQEVLRRDDRRLAAPEAFFQLGQIDDAQGKADVRGRRRDDGGCIRQMPCVLQRVVAHDHGRGGDRWLRRAVSAESEA